MANTRQNPVQHDLESPNAFEAHEEQRDADELEKELRRKETKRGRGDSGDGGRDHRDDEAPHDGEQTHVPPRPNRTEHDDDHEHGDEDGGHHGVRRQPHHMPARGDTHSPVITRRNQTREVSVSLEKAS